MRFVLASASPRRADLLSAAGFLFETLAVDVDERIRPHEAPREYVRRLAAEKSGRALELVSLRRSRRIRETDAPEAASEKVPHLTAAAGFAASRKLDRESNQESNQESIVVLGADTAVLVDADIFGKPRDDAEAVSMLQRLSGRSHQVLTGVSLRDATREIGRVDVTTVEFAPLSASDLAWYIASGEGRDKAGAYAIQGLGSRFIPRIEGSYTNVVGLPIAMVHELLHEIASDRQSGYSGR